MALSFAFLAITAAYGAGAFTKRLPTSDARLQESFISIVQDTPNGAVLDLTRLPAAPAWDEITFFGPYAYNDIARRLLGYDFDVEELSPWTYTEGGAIVVVSRDRAFAGFFELPTSVASAHCIELLTVARDNATFTVRDGTLGSRDLTMPRDRCGTD